MKKKYRIVNDNYGCYVAQFRPWWWPFWTICYGYNLSHSVDQAQTLIDRHSGINNINVGWK